MGYGTFHCTFAEIEQRLLARGTIAKHEIIHVVMVSEPHIIIGESLAKNLKNGSTEQTYTGMRRGEVNAPLPVITAKSIHAPTVTTATATPANNGTKL